MTQPFAARPALLLTRPQGAAERFARQFQARFGQDWPVLLSPLMDIEPVPATIPAAEGVIFTSAHAVVAVAGAIPEGTPACCVGRSTAEAAVAAGFTLRTQAPDAATLFAQISAQPLPGTWLHARGEETAFPLAQKLRENGHDTLDIIVYRQRARALSAEASALLRGQMPVLLPVFSPNSGRFLLQATQGARAPLLLATISQAAADACHQMPRAGLCVATTPDAGGMLDALAVLLNECVG